MFQDSAKILLDMFSASCALSELHIRQYPLPGAGRQVMIIRVTDLADWGIDQGQPVAFRSHNIFRCYPFFVWGFDLPDDLFFVDTSPLVWSWVFFYNLVHISSLPLYSFLTHFYPLSYQCISQVYQVFF